MCELGVECSDATKLSLDNFKIACVKLNLNLDEL